MSADTAAFSSGRPIGEIFVEDGRTFYRTRGGESRQVCNFGIRGVAIRRKPGEQPLAELVIEHNGDGFGVKVTPDVFLRRRRFEDQIASQRFGMVFRPAPFNAKAVLRAMSRYVAEEGGRR